MLTFRLPLAKHIPRQTRNLWSQVLTEAVRRAAQLGTEEAWLRLLMLPKCCLWLPNQKVRGGRGRSRGVNTLHSILQARLRRWQSGEERDLWGEYRRECGGRKGRAPNAEMVAGVKQARRKAAECSIPKRPKLWILQECTR